MPKVGHESFNTLHSFESFADLLVFPPGRRQTSSSYMPYCHAVLHRRVPPYSINEVKAFLQKQHNA